LSLWAKTLSREMVPYVSHHSHPWTSCRKLYQQSQHPLRPCCQIYFRQWNSAHYNIVVWKKKIFIRAELKKCFVLGSYVMCY
jgi:hypothetical protein